MNELSTIGYEGSSIDDFIETLKLAKIEVLLDVRDLPLSRKKGFSKKALTLAVEEAGLRYVHLKALGDPKPGREAARRGDFETFKNIFTAHMKTSPSQSALTEAIELVRNAKVCLLCFERDHTCCHRTIVADEIAGRSKVKLRHIGVKQGLTSKRSGAGHVINRNFAFG
jgi:uncharacterized protein (DUF488 family)